MVNKTGLREKVVLGIIILLLITGGVWRAVEVAGSRSEVIMTGGEEEQHQVNVEPELITVHIVGAVEKPGVYHLPDGARIYELLELCGGLTAEADGETVNQARPLFDGEQVQIYLVGEIPSMASSGGSSGAKININRATAAELTALPGIGEVRAGQIVDHREKNGLFKDTREIMDVGGIGEKTYQSIVELITVY